VPEAATDHLKQLMHGSLVEVAEHLRHPDKINAGGSELVVSETVRDQQARVLPCKPLPGDLLMARFDGGRVIIDTNIPPRLQIADEGDATL
jgi:hypothetical protein